MRTRIPVYCAAITLLIAANGFAGNPTMTERLVKDIPLEVGGTLWIDNPVGSIDIVGGDTPNMVARVTKTTTGADAAALAEAREQTVISFEGDRNVRLIRTILPPTRPTRWTSTVSYTLRVPRTVHVRVASKIADRIRVANINGNVTVKTFNGMIVLDNVTGASIVDTTNGKVIYQYRQKPSSNAQIQAVNADIEVNVPADSNFNWIADTLRGDVTTNLSMRAEFQGSALKGTVNAPGGPMLAMQTLLGSIRLLGNGLDVQNARSLRADAEHVTERKTLMMQPARRIQLPIAGGAFDFFTSIGDVEVGEVHGPARVQTGAGEIRLGLVYGDCNVVSLGGPLDLGDIMGTLVASTQAGDVLVRAAREGGRASTAGGIIRVLYSGGPMILQSGGGDIVVRQAAGPINAETRSGDITITADPIQRTQKIQAHTLQGNILLNVGPRFAGDIDAVVMTSDPDSRAIYSDFTGLQIKKDQVGGKTRIHATGKLNGGGERLELFAEEGDIHISKVITNPVTVMSPK